MPANPTRSTSASTSKSSAKGPRVALAEGDGIGPEIISATLAVLEAAKARLDLQPVAVGEQVYRAGYSTGISPETWDVVRESAALLKGPITTPQGGGYKSVNVSIRKRLGLFANIRPCIAYHPYVATRHPGLDVVVVRENEEDTYGGIEHRQTREVHQCLKLITRPGCERLVRHAFEYARANGRRKLTCLTKDNIMKLTDGLFHRVFDEIAADYPELESDHLIIDIGTARLATRPEAFDVVVLPNLYGDIVSDVLAEMAGSVGLAASANIGEHCSMFEAIHGSAPDIAGRGVANPSGVLLAAVMMLIHLGQSEVAERIHNAWLRTIEDGVSTPDIYDESKGKRRVNTQEFGQAVIANLGERPRELSPVSYGAGEGETNQAARASSTTPPSSPAADRPRVEKQLIGVDVFVDWEGPERSRDPDELAELLRRATPSRVGLSLEMITNRGTTVWPSGIPETFCTDHWRCRFRPGAGKQIEPADGRDVVLLQAALVSNGVEIIKTENLYAFDGKPGFSLGQG